MLTVAAGKINRVENFFLFLAAMSCSPNLATKTVSSVMISDVFTKFILRSWFWNIGLVGTLAGVYHASRQQCFNSTNIIGSISLYFHGYIKRSLLVAHSQSNVISTNLAVKAIDTIITTAVLTC